MGSREQADMDFKSRAISAQETKQIVTVFSKECDKIISYMLSDDLQRFLGEIQKW